jgi:transcription initiation factor TFIIB
MCESERKLTIRVKLRKINCDENIKSMNEYETIHLAEQKPSNKTQKKKKNISTTSKSKLWEVFDSDRKTITELSDDKMECLYSSGTNKIFSEKETCSVCGSNLMIMEDGFPTCTNVTCCIMYKDVLDYSPEWRFYGSEDKNAADPTRCGNPINPLLMESSFGCKIVLRNEKNS